MHSILVHEINCMIGSSAYQLWNSTFVPSHSQKQTSRFGSMLLTKAVCQLPSKNLITLLILFSCFAIAHGRSSNVSTSNNGVGPLGKDTLQISERIDKELISQGCTVKNEGTKTKERENLNEWSP